MKITYIKAEHRDDVQPKTLANALMLEGVFTVSMTDVPQMLFDGVSSESLYRDAMQQISQLTELCNNRQEEIAVFQSRIQEREDEICDLEKCRDSLEAAVVEREGTISVLQSQHTECRQRVLDLTEEAWESDRKLCKLNNEVERLKKGQFTEEEFQNLCHKIPSDQAHNFCDGCDDYQRKLLGWCRTDRMQKALDASNREVDRLLRLKEERSLSYGALQYRVNVLLEENASLKSEHDRLNKELTAKELAIASLEGVERLSNATIGELQDEIAALRSRVKTLEKIKDEQHNRIQKIRNLT